ncbi:MAG: hypothetical protein MK132_23060 [Lentisphaerales bacterium]|nr:hypothetical protein [Lentisphaerales bacterium]
MPLSYCDATRAIGNGWQKLDQLAVKGVGMMMIYYADHPAIDKGERYYKKWIGGYFKNGKSVNPF